jgi:hypothetical protein
MPGESKTSPRALASALRMRKAFELRVSGLSYEAIGGELGVNHARAYQLVAKWLRRLLLEPAEEVRRLELERLDRAFAKVWEAAEANHDFSWVPHFLAIMDRRARLLGLDIRVKHPVELTGVHGEPLIPDAPSMTPDEAAVRLAQIFAHLAHQEGSSGEEPGGEPSVH